MVSRLFAACRVHRTCGTGREPFFESPRCVHCTAAGEIAVDCMRNPYPCGLLRSVCPTLPIDTADHIVSIERSESDSHHIQGLLVEMGLGPVVDGLFSDAALKPRRFVLILQAERGGSHIAGEWLGSASSDLT